MPVDDPSEHFWLVDENDNELGRITRGEAHSDRNKIHRSAGVVITNFKGELLLQKRSKHKDLQPGFWGMSVGGHVSYGDSYEETAKREMEEELGINPTIRLVTIKLIVDPEEKEFTAIYETIIGETPTNFDRDEIDELIWVPIKKLKDFTKDQKVTNGAVAVMRIMGFIE